MNRRRFLLDSAILASTFSVPSILVGKTQATNDKRFMISLAQWSVRNLIFGGDIWKNKDLKWRDKADAMINHPEKIICGSLDPLDFPQYAREECGISAVEYVNTFFYRHADDEAYLGELKKRADDYGIDSVLIMVDMAGDLGHTNPSERTKAIEKHQQWVRSAAFLGCTAIRVNSHSRGPWEMQIENCALGISTLAEYAKSYNIDIVVENHGGLSSNGKWISELMQKINLPNVGTLPDFGNFKEYDKYQGVEEMMPYAKGVSAKCYKFNDDGLETSIDFERMLNIVKASGYTGYIGIEFEGWGADPTNDILKAKALLERYI